MNKIKLAKQLVKIAKALVADSSITVKIKSGHSNYVHLGDDAIYIKGEYSVTDNTLIKSDVEEIKKDLDSRFGRDKWGAIENIYRDGFSVGIFDDDNVKNALACVKQTLKKLGRRVI